jgi:hypothetical protein
MRNFTLNPKAGNSGRTEANVVGIDGITLSFQSKAEFDDLLNGIGEQKALWDNVDGAGEDEDCYVEGLVWFKNGKMIDFDGYYDVPTDLKYIINSLGISSNY